MLLGFKLFSKTVVLFDNSSLPQQSTTFPPEGGVDSKILGNYFFPIIELTNKHSSRTRLNEKDRKWINTSKSKIFVFYFGCRPRYFMVHFYKNIKSSICFKNNCFSTKVSRWALVGEFQYYWGLWVCNYESAPVHRGYSRYVQYK